MLPVALDHCVIHVSDWERSNAFYTGVLGAELIARPVGFAYRFGDRQLNVHGPGVAPAEVARLPVAPGASVYFRDPDGSLMEFISYARPAERRGPREAPGQHDPNVLPNDLPLPQDDGAARHLPGRALPDLALLATRGGAFNVSILGGRTVLYIYPRTGVPGVELPPGWDDIPGARGCTPQSCSFRDYFAKLKALGVVHVFGLSSQDTDYQREVAERLHLPFPLLSDAELKFMRALDLPTFTVAGMMLLKRMALIIDDGVIAKVFYPVFPPDQSATEVVSWLRQSPR